MVLVPIAVVMIPIMLLPKPLILKSRAAAGTLEHDPADPHAGEDFEFGEVFIHQVIETIEFVLGAISNTASYLRLWALSLAHSQLTDVFFEKCLGMAIAHVKTPNMAGVTGGLVMFFGFAMWLAATFGVLMVMESLSAVLHALRLHWVEFQNKFYKGDGRKFEPFSFASLRKQEALETQFRRSLEAVQEATSSRDALSTRCDDLAQALSSSQSGAASEGSRAEALSARVAALEQALAQSEARLDSSATDRDALGRQLAEAVAEAVEPAEAEDTVEPAQTAEAVDAVELAAAMETEATEPRAQLAAAELQGVETPEAVDAANTAETAVVVGNAEPQAQPASAEAQLGGTTAAAAATAVAAAQAVGTSAHLVQGTSSADSGVSTQVPIAPVPAAAAGADGDAGGGGGPAALHPTGR
jgi:hypothetical protein